MYLVNVASMNLQMVMEHSFFSYSQLSRHLLSKSPSFLCPEAHFDQCVSAPSERIEEELPYQREQQHSVALITDPLQALQMQPAAIQELHMHWLAHMAQFDANQSPSQSDITHPNLVPCNACTFTMQ